MAGSWRAAAVACHVDASNAMCHVNVTHVTRRALGSTRSPRPSPLPLPNAPSLRDVNIRHYTKYGALSQFEAYTELTFLQL